MSSVKHIEITNIPTETARKPSKTPGSSILVSKHSDINLMKSQTSKKPILPETPSVCISTVKQDKASKEKFEQKKTNGKPKNSPLLSRIKKADDDDVICID